MRAFCRVAAGALLPLVLSVACAGRMKESAGAPEGAHGGFTESDAAETLRVPASTSLASPVTYPRALSSGDRLLIEAAGEVDGFRTHPAGGIGAGALVASFAGSPAFLVGSGRLLWTAPAAGRLAFGVHQRGGRRLTGGYSVRLRPLGPRGDPRQRAFPPPAIDFLPASRDGPLLAVRYEDRSGFGLDGKTLQVVLDLEGGERLVLSPYFVRDPAGAALPALPREVRVPPGVHRVRATIGDALGNVSPPAEIFLDQP